MPLTVGQFKRTSLGAGPQAGDYQVDLADHSSDPRSGRSDRAPCSPTSQSATAMVVEPGDASERGPGPRILDVVADRLELSEGALAESRGVLAEHGNCSSATILVVLDRLTQDRDLRAGEAVVALAFGPGLTLYAALLEAAT